MATPRATTWKAIDAQRYRRSSRSRMVDFTCSTAPARESQLTVKSSQSQLRVVSLGDPVGHRRHEAGGGGRRDSRHPGTFLALERQDHGDELEGEEGESGSEQPGLDDDENGT